MLYSLYNLVVRTYVQEENVRTCTMYVRLSPLYSKSGNLWVMPYKYGAVQNFAGLTTQRYSAILSQLKASPKKMAPAKADAAFILRQFIDLGRSNPKKSKRYRCRHCQKDFAATSIGRPKEHLAACEKWQAKQRQERRARDNTGCLPSYSEATQKKITEVGIQHISQDESHSFAYDAAAAVIAGGRPSASSRAVVGVISSLVSSLAGSLPAAPLSQEFSPTSIRNSTMRFSSA